MHFACGNEHEFWRTRGQTAVGRIMAHKDAGNLNMLRYMAKRNFADVIRVKGLEMRLLS